MKVFVTGGTGFLGHALTPRLIADGHEVTVLALTPNDMAIAQQLGAKAVRGDLSNQRVLEAAMSGHDCIVHAAAYMDHWGVLAQFRKVNVDGTKTMLAAAQASGVGRFVHVSAASVVLSLEPTEGNESLPVVGADFCGYSQTKAEAESIVLASDRPGFATIAIRPPMIWGAGDKATLPAIVEAVETGRFAFVEGGTFKTSTCHVENVAEAVVKAVAADAHGEAFFVTDGPARTNHAVISALLATQGVAAPTRRVPRWLLVGLGRACEMGWKVLRLKSHPPVTRSLVMLTGVHFALDDSRARQLLGYRGEAGWEQGLEGLRNASRNRSVR
jgi:nucleoside-diphosphate-sugar epimerase